MFGWFSKKNTTDETEDKGLKTEYFTDVKIVADFFEHLTGVTFVKQLSILESKTKSFCRQRDIFSYEELLEKIKRDKTLKQELINYLTTNETFFYREFKQIGELVSLVQNRNDNVTILCAPCATGEESYSIAIALLEADVSPQRFHILGIDINSQAIEKAKNASYRERGVKNLSEDVLYKYFKKSEERYELRDNVKNLVQFRVMNIFDPEFQTLEKFDYIFSRNMLIYFDAQTKQKAKTLLESMRKENSTDVFFGHADLF